MTQKKPPTVHVTFGSLAFQVPKMSIGQVERVADLLTGDLKPRSKTFAILRIALERATPAVENVDEIEAEPGEVSAAVDKILAHAGFVAPDPNSPAPPGAES